VGPLFLVVEVVARYRLADEGADQQQAEGDREGVIPGETAHAGASVVGEADRREVGNADHDEDEVDRERGPHWRP
jgi:hypothetical protein